tara:strand:+ start:191 stop:1048 length:858 start_codon:yes stop_codon:yes gene_type:complete
MEQVDLNINNYSLDDILNLFNISHNFSYDDLKAAKKMVLKTHPDKSKLDKEYFLFFTKAYKMLYKIYEFKNQTNTKSTSYVVEKDEAKEKELEKIKGKENFNEWFNELFEKNQLSNLNTSNGYGDWLKSDDDCHESEAKNITEMNQEIENKKTKIRDLIPHEDISEVNGNMGFSIIEDECGFQSDLFSNLQYDDLRKAHGESVIPVTHEDYTSKKRFNSVNEMQNYRAQQDTKPLSLEQSKQYLEQKDNNETEVSTKRAFQLAREYETNKEKSKNWWSQIKQITQ